MGVNVEELKVWYTSLQTHFTKLNKKKSRDGSSVLRPRPVGAEPLLPPGTFTYEVRRRPLVSVNTCEIYYIYFWACIVFLSLHSRCLGVCC